MRFLRQVRVMIRKKNSTRFPSTKLGFGSSSERDTCFADHERSEVGGKPTISLLCCGSTRKVWPPRKGSLCDSIWCKLYDVWQCSSVDITAFRGAFTTGPYRGTEWESRGAAGKIPNVGSVPKHSPIHGIGQFANTLTNSNWWVIWNRLRSSRPELGS